MTEARALDFLLTTWEGGGNVPPLLAAARRLLARGHRVRVLSDACNRAEIEAVGAEAVSWTRAPSRPDKSAATDFLRDWEAPTPVASVECLVERVICGPAEAYALDTRDELRRRPADALVASEMLFGSIFAAEAERVPLAVLTTNIPLFPVEGLPPFGPGLLPAETDAERRQHAEIAADAQQLFDRFLPGLNHQREAFGLPPLAHLFDQMTRADRVLVGTARAFDFPGARLPSHVRYVGPLLDDPPWASEWRSPWPTDAREPLVLVGLSTTYQAQGPTLQRILDALGALPVRGLATLGPALDADAFRAPANTVLCRSAPHARVLREASAAVIHAGHGTAIRALAAGVPTLCLPMGRDQNDNAARIRARGAGLQLAPDAPSDAIRAALARLLDEPGFRQQAQALGARVRAEAEASPLVAELEALARRERTERAA